MSTSLADSSGRRNTYYKLSMWSDDYDKEICTGWVSAALSKEKRSLII